ncbi:Hypothetical protein CINCED_3A003585 [Cinara cedri]|uniref:Uncharacterized protein n=1 Tax=Cinara cedri TaxID=506608 RepID=A0A5E4NMY2_9HEMI|nr:Hypothetical protein CINCED_3A003585 [Cinara cedri]
MIRAKYLRAVCILSVAVAQPPPVTGLSDLENAFVKANAKGFPTDLLYSAVGLEGRSDDNKAQLAKALETPQVQNDVRKAAVNYAVKEVPTTRESTEGYCSYSWLRWLPYMDCAEPSASESRQTLQLINTNRNCMR